MDHKDRLTRILDTGFDLLTEKISHGSIHVDNEASFQLQYSYILKTLGSLYEFDQNDRFIIELEKSVLIE